MRHRRSKLVGFVRDSFVKVFCPCRVADQYESDDDIADIAATYNTALRVPFTRTWIPASGHNADTGEAAQPVGSKLVATPLSPRFLVDGDPIEWTETSLYLKFLADLRDRVPGMPISVDEQGTVLKVTIRSRWVEAWIQMTVDGTLRELNITSL